MPDLQDKGDILFYKECTGDSGCALHSQILLMVNFGKISYIDIYQKMIGEDWGQMSTTF